MESSHIKAAIESVFKVRLAISIFRVMDNNNNIDLIKYPWEGRTFMVIWYCLSYFRPKSWIPFISFKVFVIIIRCGVFIVARHAWDGYRKLEILKGPVGLWMIFTLVSSVRRCAVAEETALTGSVAVMLVMMVSGINQIFQLDFIHPSPLKV